MLFTSRNAQLPLLFVKAAITPLIYTGITVTAGQLDSVRGHPDTIELPYYADNKMDE